MGTGRGRLPGNAHRQPPPRRCHGRQLPRTRPDPTPGRVPHPARPSHPRPHRRAPRSPAGPRDRSRRPPDPRRLRSQGDPHSRQPCRPVHDGSDSPTEADAIADVLLNRGVPEHAIALERLAANTSENFWLAAELLRDRGLDPATFLAVTKPYAERRTIATARRRWPHKTVAATSQQTTFDQYLDGAIPPQRILSHLAGEALRLEVYAATGLIEPSEPDPENILTAARQLQAAGFNSRAIR